MNCILVTFGIAMFLNNDTPLSLAIEDCGDVELRATIHETKQIVNIIDSVDGIYYVELKDK